jgi:hypothetical protein
MDGIAFVNRLLLLVLYGMQKNLGERLFYALSGCLTAKLALFIGSGVL